LSSDDDDLLEEFKRETEREKILEKERGRDSIIKSNIAKVKVEGKITSGREAYEKEIKKRRKKCGHKAVMMRKIRICHHN